MKHQQESNHWKEVQKQVQLEVASSPTEIRLNCQTIFMEFFYPFLNLLFGSIYKILLMTAIIINVR